MMDNISYNSYESKINSILESIKNQFIRLPYYFFNEYEFHYWLRTKLNEFRRGRRNYLNMKIKGEFPTSHRFSKNKNTGLKFIDDENGRLGHIDLVIQMEDVGNIGFEFYFGKENQITEVHHNDDFYFLHKRYLSLKEIEIHTLNDLLKLKNENDLKFSYIILLIATLHENERKRKNFVDKKRKKIISMLKKFKNDLPNNIKIIYVEKGYINDFLHGEREEYYAIANNDNDGPFYSRY
ncbi:MAG: hypothetical protein ACFFG0_13770 [Candidatus Thorarchaeota archaeon]